MRGTSTRRSSSTASRPSGLQRRQQRRRLLRPMSGERAAAAAAAAFAAKRLHRSRSRGESVVASVTVWNCPVSCSRVPSGPRLLYEHEGADPVQDWSNLVRPKSLPTVAEVSSPHLFFGFAPARWCSTTCASASGPGLPRERLCHPGDSQIGQNSGISGIAGRAVHATCIPRPPKLIQCRNSQNLEEGAVGEVHTRADSQSSEIAALRK